MWAVLKRSILIGGLCLAGASSSAYADFSSALEVKVPFAFVVNGQNFPAGRYSVERDADTSGALWLRGEGDNAASTFLNTRPATEGPQANQPTLEFKRVENQIRLSNVLLGDGVTRSVVGE